MSPPKKLLWDQIFPLIRITGERNREFLHGQTTGDLLNRSTGDFVRACWLSPTGRLKAILEISLQEEEAQVIVIGGDHNELVKGFNSVIFPSDQVQVESHCEVRRVQLISSEESWKNSLVNLLSGKESVPFEMESIEKVSPQKLEVWRLIQGLPSAPGEINGTTNPFELGLSDLVMLNKGCYLGQETMAKLTLVGSVKQQLRFFESDTMISVGENLFTKPLNIDDKTVAASVTSLVEAKDGNYYGLALVKRAYLSLEELFFKDTSVKVIIKMPVGFVFDLTKS